MNFVDGFRAPEYARLLAGARKAIERRQASFSLRDVDADEWVKLNGLLDLRDRAEQVRISLRRLDDAVRRSCELSLAELLETIGPKLRDRKAEKETEAEARAELLHLAEASPLYASAGWYRDWLRTRGLLTGLITEDGTRLFAQTIAILERLDARPEDAPPETLATLAVTMTGDTKALNHGMPHSSLVLGALAVQAGVKKPKAAEERRALWELVNVLTDDLASRVLVLNLPATGGGLGEWLTGAARYGTPFHVTLHQLTTLPITVRCPVAYVCENPTVLRRAAQELGPGSPPLICTEGLPSIAFHRLAEAVTAGGGTLRYHGDFDWPGIAIATAVIRRHAAEPWRMSAADYREGLCGSDHYLPLEGRARSAPWAADLSTVMTEAGVILYEESVAGHLLDDLADAG